MELHGIGRSVGDRIRRKDDQLRNLLVPHEGRIMCLQSLLVWEQPQHSALLFVTVNLVFWFVTGLRFLVLSAIIGFCASTWSLWSNYIWPEIRVKRPDDDDEEWTPVHPRLLSVPELSLQLSTKIVSVEDVFTRAMTLRKTNPLKFFVFATTGFVTMGVFGHYVPGIYLSYGSMMAVLLLPMVWYHQLDVKFKEFLNPFVNKMEESMNIKRNRSKSSAKVKVSDTSESDEEIKSLQKNQPLLKMPSVRDSDSDATGLTPRLTPNLPEINLRLDEDTDCEDPTDVSPRELPSMTSVTDTEGFPSQMPSVTSMAETMMSVDPRFDLASNSELTLGDISDNESYAEGMRDEDLVLSEVDGRRSCQRKSPVARIPEDRPLDNPSPTPLEFVPHHFKADSLMTSTDSTESKKAQKKGKKSLSLEDELAEGLEFDFYDEEDKLETNTSTNNNQEEPESGLRENLLAGALSAGAQSQVVGNLLTGALSAGAHSVQDTVASLVASQMVSSIMQRIGQSVGVGEESGRPEKGAVEDQEKEGGGESREPGDEFEMLNEEDLDEDVVGL